jgi:UDP-2,3-diacylglucosamine hydrolase
MQSCTADALFILGDLFEAWLGDDVLGQTDGFAFENECVQVLTSCAAKRPVYLLHGNRDFLLGETFFKQTGVQRLDDPCTLILNGQTLLLSHGDALCVNDLPYMQLRSVIRTSQWQTTTLAQPLATRLALATQIKMEKTGRSSTFQSWMDVDTSAAVKCLRQHGATTLVHGHTHMPRDHVLESQLHCKVLSDWEGNCQPARAEVLRWQAGNWQRLNPSRQAT